MKIANNGLSVAGKVASMSPRDESIKRIETENLNNTDTKDGKSKQAHRSSTYKRYMLNGGRVSGATDGKQAAIKTSENVRILTLDRDMFQDILSRKLFSPMASPTETTSNQAMLGNSYHP